jgi:[ribosomal protein S5]-alanine N-acetyltransferase
MPSPGKEIFGDLDFGYALAQDKWGKGYMTEALDALLTFAFETLSANRIFAECETQNIGSFRVMEKARMKRDALFTVPEESKEMFRYSIWKDHWLKLANAED